MSLLTAYCDTILPAPNCYTGEKCLNECLHLVHVKSNGNEIFPETSETHLKPPLVLYTVLGYSVMKSINQFSVGLLLKTSLPINIVIKLE